MKNNINDDRQKTDTTNINSEEIKVDASQPIPVDDIQRLKVLSPGTMVLKRFLRSKLAIVGSVLLIFMFTFTFLGGLISPYKQQQIFHKTDVIPADYGMAAIRTEFSNIMLTNEKPHYKLLASINSYISSLSDGQEELKVSAEDGHEYLLQKLGNNAYMLYQIKYNMVGSYKSLGGVFDFEDSTYDTDDFKTAFLAEWKTNIKEFVYDSISFKVERKSGSYNIYMPESPQETLIATNLVFDSHSEGVTASTNFRIATLRNLYTEQKSFSYDGKDYKIEVSTKSDDIYTIYNITDGIKTPFMNLSQFAVRRYNGEDTLPIAFKFAVQAFIANMAENGINRAEFSYVVDDILLEDEEQEIPDGIIAEADTGEATLFDIERKLDNYVIRSNQNRYLIDIYGAPSGSHWLGTDANGMDVLTRIMYGGRISLLIGFIVIFIEMLIGVILGGIAGYFGKWVDQLIMRLVDIIYCIPTMPILIILGTLFDKLQMDPYERIMWMMIVLGVLGWPGIARLIRGQILSLREQEFMIAAEATGISAHRRIFRHLVPNVMPQLIVNATMGLGGIIITESTLSFLGLGAKYPIATWGSMINSVSSASALINYTYIWIPVGVLICLTVIAFNFVGDGLRDAFDPKMKR